MHYRLYNPNDFASLYAIEEVCFQRPLRFSRAYMRRLIDAGTSATWIADAHGAMAGFGIVEWERRAVGIHAYVPTIEVAPEYRRHGVGTGLLRRLEISAMEAGACLIWLHVDKENEGAIQLYELQGYIRMAHQEDFYAPGRGAYRYRKELRAGKAASTVDSVNLG